MIFSSDRNAFSPCRFHVAAVYDSFSDVTTLYLNGKRITDDSTRSTVSFSSFDKLTNLWIGRWVRYSLKRLVCEGYYECKCLSPTAPLPLA